MNNNILAIILGGGQGSRLAPLTESRSKPQFPLPENIAWLIFRFPTALIPTLKECLS